MGSRVAASTGAGVIAGIVFGAMMHMMTAPMPHGGQIPVIAMVGRIVGSPTVTAGWVYHPFNSAVIGASFGWLLGARVQGYGSALGWGAAYGFAWWIFGGLILMPVLLGMPAFAPLTMPEMQMVAMGSLIGRAAPQRRPGTQRRVNADHAGQCSDLSRKTPRNLAIWRLDTESWHAGSVP
jgi:hypothetical protein